MSYKGLNLDGRIAVVTGGTSGIGRIFSLAMAEAGAHVVPTSRRPEQVDAVAKEIEERGRRTLRVAADAPCEATSPRSTAAGLVADNALAPCMPLLEALAADDPATLQLTLGERTALHVQVGPA